MSARSNKLHSESKRSRVRFNPTGPGPKPSSAHSLVRTRLCVWVQLWLGGSEFELGITNNNRSHRLMEGRKKQTFAPKPQSKVSACCARAVTWSPAQRCTNIKHCPNRSCCHCVWRPPVIGHFPPHRKSVRAPRLHRSASIEQRGLSTPRGPKNAHIYIPRLPDSFVIKLLDGHRCVCSRLLKSK